MALWPSSSTTSIAVSWSIVWLMVAMTPMFMSTLMTSVALTESFCARSATMTVSPTATSRLTGAVGFSKPWRGSASAGAVRALRRFFFLCRALTSPAMCNSWRAPNFGRFSSAARIGLFARRGMRRSRRLFAPRFGWPPRRWRSASSWARCSAWRRASSWARTRACSSSIRRRLADSIDSRSRRSISALAALASCAASASRRWASTCSWAARFCSSSTSRLT